MTSSGRRGAGISGHWVAWLILALCAFEVFRGYLASPIDDRVAVVEPARMEARDLGRRTPTDDQSEFWRSARIWDRRFIIWVIARNARTFATQPQRLHAAEICHPTENALALGEPAITLGLLAVPVWLATRDPIATYNAVLVVVTLIAVLAMYLLIVDWTRSPPAATTAALLYGFSIIRVGDLAQIAMSDSTWLVFCLFFARRLAANDRWRDALGLAASAALQLGCGLYPVLATLLVAAPFGIWLVIHYGLRSLSPLRWGTALAIALLVGVLSFAPALELASQGVLQTLDHKVFLIWADLLPGGSAFLGWTPVALALVGLALGRGATRQTLGADPRWAVLAGLVLILAVATGGNAGDRTAALLAGREPPLALPNPYDWLAAVLPGLSVVKTPAQLSSDLQVPLCILAGLGVAGALRHLVGRVRLAVAALLVALAALEMVRPAVFGFEPRIPRTLVSLRPSGEELAFYRELSDRGGTAGPILELPLMNVAFERTTLSILHSAYHGRATSACYNSFMPPAQARLVQLAEALPGRRGFWELRQLGFTTIVIHHPSDRPLVQQLRRRFARYIERHPPPGGGLVPLAADDDRSAYELVAPGQAAGAPEPEPPGPRTSSERSD